MILSVVSDAMQLIDVDDNADTKLAQQISQISGVGQVSIGGEQKPSVRIQIDPAKLYAKGLSLEDVRTPLSITTVNSPKGNVDGDKRSFTIYANDQLIDADDWNDVILAYRDGAPVRVRDIGLAVPGPEDAKKAAWANGKRGVFLVVFKQPGANVIDTVDKIKAALPHLRAAMPPALHVDVLSDRTQTIRASVQDVEMTLLLTIALVVLVIFMFLRSLWATIIPSVTVPLALLGACALMYLAGYSLDNLSLMALHDLGRLRRRRCHRHAREHRAPRRGRRVALRGRAQGLGRDRLHHPIDQHLADRRVHSAPLDERHHRAAVPRVRRHRQHDDRGLCVRLADADADDGVALPEAEQTRPRTAGSISITERGFDTDAPGLRAHARRRDAPSLR